MKRKKIIGAILAGLIFVSIFSCSGGVLSSMVTKISEKSMESFSFPLTLNGASGFESDLDGVVNTSGGTINVSVPWDWTVDLSPSLVAVFSYQGMSVTVDGVSQVSGTTANDFSSSDTTPVQYRITDGTGEAVSFGVSLIQQEPPGARITDFAVSQDSSLWYEAELDQADFTAITQVPVVMPLTSLYIRFTLLGGDELYLMPSFIQQTSEVDTQDFSTSLVFSVRNSGDSSTQEYTVTVLATLGS